jgi:hypothetical protein
MAEQIFGEPRTTQFFGEPRTTNVKEAQDCAHTEKVQEEDTALELYTTSMHKHYSPR